MGIRINVNVVLFFAFVLVRALPVPPPLEITPPDKYSVPRVPPSGLSKSDYNYSGRRHENVAGQSPIELPPNDRDGSSSPGSPLNYPGMIYPPNAKPLNDQRMASVGRGAPPPSFSQSPAGQAHGTPVPPASGSSGNRGEAPSQVPGAPASSSSRNPAAASGPPVLVSLDRDDGEIKEATFAKLSPDNKPTYRCPLDPKCYRVNQPDRELGFFRGGIVNHIQSRHGRMAFLRQGAAGQAPGPASSSSSYRASDSRQAPPPSQPIAGPSRANAPSAPVSQPRNSEHKPAGPSFPLADMDLYVSIDGEIKEVKFWRLAQDNTPTYSCPIDSSCRRSGLPDWERFSRKGITRHVLRKHQKVASFRLPDDADVRQYLRSKGR